MAIEENTISYYDALKLIKRYNEALKVAKSNYKTIVQMDKDCTFAKEGIVNTFHHMFPELKESEDEKIRQFLIHEVTETSDEIMSYRNMNKKDVLAWLEKQSEHANFRNKIQIGDKVTRNEAGILVNISQLNRIAKPAKRRGRQKSTDKEMIEILRTEYEKGKADVIAEMQKLVRSKEDEEMISDIATYLNRYGNYILNKNEEKAAEIHKAADWIKSLKDRIHLQNKWKPSDEQMKALKTAKDSSFDLSFKTKDILQLLYNDLKKLL